MGRTNPPVFYGHHPALVPLGIAATYAIFGFRDASAQLPPDWQTRLITSLCTLGCIVTIYILLRNRSGTRAALIAACVFAALPITMIYGGMPEVVGPQLLLFVLFTLVAYERFQTTPAPRTLLLTCVPFAFALFSDWPAMFLVPILVAHFVLTKPRKDWLWIGGFAFIAALLFFLAYAQVWLVTRDWLWMRELLIRRTFATVNDQLQTFGWREWFRGAIVKHAVHLLTLPVLLLGGGWLCVVISRRRRPLDRAATLTLLL